MASITSFYQKSKGDFWTFGTRKVRAISLLFLVIWGGLLSAQNIDGQEEGYLNDGTPELHLNAPSSFILEEEGEDGEALLGISLDQGLTTFGTDPAEAPALQPPLPPEICNNGIDDDADNLVDCYDPDCSGSIDCAGSIFSPSVICANPPAPGSFAMKEDWRTDTSLHDVFSTQTPISADINLDGIPEVLAYDHNDNETSVSTAGPGDTIFIFNGTDGTIVGFLDLTSTGSNAARQNTSGIAVGNLDGDPFAEIIVVLQNTSIARFEHTGGAPTWVSPPLSASYPFPNQPIPNLADLDEDGNAEVYLGNAVINGQNGTLIGAGGFTFGATALGAPIGGSNGLVVYGMSVAADVLPDAFCADCAGKEIVAGYQVYSVNVGTGTVTHWYPRPSRPDFLRG